MSAATTTKEQKDEITWEDCLDNFKEELGRLGTWDVRMHSEARKEDYISCVDAMDVKTDPSVGWEKYTTFQELKRRNAIPSLDTVSDTELLALMDELQVKEFAVLDGLNPKAGPFSCAYLYDIDGFTKDSSMMKAYLNSYLCHTYLCFSACSRIIVLDNEENFAVTNEILELCRNVNVPETMKALSEEIPKIKSDNLRQRVQLRWNILNAIYTLMTRSSCTSKVVDNAINLCKEIATSIRETIIPSHKSIGDASGFLSKAFPKDAFYWLSGQVMPLPTITFEEHMPRIANYFEGYMQLNEFSNCQNFYEVAALCEHISGQDPLVLTRAITGCFVFCEGEHFLGGAPLPVHILRYLEFELGAPLYSRLMENHKPSENALLSEVIHYQLARSSSGRVTDNDVQMIGPQFVAALSSWLTDATNAVSQLIQAALFNHGRYHRRLGNNLTALGLLQLQTLDLEFQIFCTHVPHGSSTGYNDEQKKEFTQLSSVLSGFVTELICDTMEKYVRLTGALGLATKPELGALGLYAHLLSNSRVEQILALQVRGGKGQAPLPERRVNKRTGMPLAAPCLTSRVSVQPNALLLGRADISRVLGEMSMLALATLHHNGLISGYGSSAPATSLISAGEMFDHRFSLFPLRVRKPLLPPYSLYKSRFDSVEHYPLSFLLGIIISTVSQLLETTIQTTMERCEETESPMKYQLIGFQKSARAMVVSLTLLRSLLYDTVVESNNREVHPPTPSKEQMEKRLGDYVVLVENSFEKSCFVPVLRKQPKTTAK